MFTNDSFYKYNGSEGQVYFNLNELSGNSDGLCKILRVKAKTTLQQCLGLSKGSYQVYLNLPTSMIIKII